MQREAAIAADYLKALSHEARLRILWHLGTRELSVTELESLLGTRQSAVSQHLARLRSEGIVSSRREGKAIYYSVRDSRTQATIAHLTEMFRTPER